MDKNRYLGFKQFTGPLFAMWRSMKGSKKNEEGIVIGDRRKRTIAYEPIERTES